MTEQYSELGGAEAPEDRLHERIVYWQPILRSIHPDLEDLPNVLRTEIIDDLDSLWDYEGRRIAFRGYGAFEGILKSDNETVSDETFIPYGEATSIGFDLIPMYREGKRQWRICHCFSDDTDFMNHPLAHLANPDNLETALVALDASDATVLPIAEVERVYLEGMFNVVSKGSEDLMAVYEAPTFLSLEGQEQKDALWHFMKKVEQKANALHQLVDVPVRIVSDQVYVLMPGKDAHYEQIEMNGVDFSGEAKGLGILELRQLPEQRITSRKDCVDPYAGLCIIVEPSQETIAGLQLCEYQRLWVPVGAENKISVQFLYDADQNEAA
jgi:hypothetical protein